MVTCTYCCKIMENVILRTRNSCQQLIRKYSRPALSSIVEKERIIHPYRKIHPWKSLKSFTKHLLDNVIYNKDGLVVINKPYGISREPRKADAIDRAMYNMINSCSYTLSDSLPDIAKELDYAELALVKCPERYMSGLTLLAANQKVFDAVRKSSQRAQAMKILPSTYWIITTQVPKEIAGKQRLALTLQENKGNKKPVILTTWTENERKRKDIKIFNVEFRLLSNSTENLSSLIEVKASTRKWHAIRLFAATKLFSPVLGDNYHSSRIQKIMGSWINVNPFIECTEQLPNLNRRLLELLKLTPAKQEIIPAHIHLQKLHLPQFLADKKDLILEAPLLYPFDWTCAQLKFSYTANMPDKCNDKNVNIKQECWQ